MKNWDFTFYVFDRDCLIMKLFSLSPRVPTCFCSDAFLKKFDPQLFSQQSELNTSLHIKTGCRSAAAILFWLFGKLQQFIQIQKRRYMGGISQDVKRPKIWDFTLYSLGFLDYLNLCCFNGNYHVF